MICPVGWNGFIDEDAKCVPPQFTSADPHHPLPKQTIIMLQFSSWDGAHREGCGCRNRVVDLIPLSSGMHNGGFQCEVDTGINK